MHVGRGASSSKTECTFFPLPSSFNICNTTKLLWWWSNIPSVAHIPTPTHINSLSNLHLACPTRWTFCHVIVASSHPTHVGKEGVVCRLTKKFVIFTPNKDSTNIVCIFPKSLTTYHHTDRLTINSATNDGEHNPGQTEREHAMYNKLNETQDFLIADGFVSFTITMLTDGQSTLLPTMANTTQGRLNVNTPCMISSMRHMTSTLLMALSASPGHVDTWAHLFLIIFMTTMTSHPDSLQ